MNEVTFFVWADTHFGYHQQFAAADFRGGIVEQMNRLPGWPYPPQIGGYVDKPAMVMHAGDVVDGGARSADELQISRIFCTRLKWPHYVTLGNHDTSHEYLADFIATHGSRSYSFDLAGWHVLSVDATYDVGETARIDGENLQFIRDDLGSVSSGTPSLLFTHASLRRLANADEVVAALAPYDVPLAFGGHYHCPGSYQEGGTTCIDVGHCRNHPIDAKYGCSFTVVRVRDGCVTAIPWRWDLQDWESGQDWSSDPAKCTAAAARLILHRAL